MPDEKQPPQQADETETNAPVETEESGAGYGNNAGEQGADPSTSGDRT